MVPALPILLAYIPISAAFFAVFRPLKAVGLAYLIGHLMLPIEEFKVQGFWDIDKILVTNFGVILGTFMFCPKQLRAYRFHVADVFIVMVCLSEFLASFFNDLGIKDGVSRFMFRFFLYAAPYFAGRIYLRTKEDLIELARLIVIASSLYALLAAWEFRMSPQLHQTIYGTFQHSFAQHKRWLFYRPVIFFPHALALGVFFAWTGFLGIWMYASGYLPRHLHLPQWLIAFAPMALVPASAQFDNMGVMVAVAMICLGWAAMIMTLRGKPGQPPGTVTIHGGLIVICPIIGLATSMSLGPIVIFLAGLGLLLAWDLLRSKWVAFIPMAFAVVWMTGRYSNLTDGRWLVESFQSISERAARSLGYRVEAEDVILNHAKERALFGWGTHGRNRIIDERGHNARAIDGLWLNIVSIAGLFGLVSFFLWWFWPLVMLAELPGDVRGEPIVQVTLIATGMQAVNFMFNGFLSPVLSLLVGCTVTILAATTIQRRRRPQPRPVTPNAPPVAPFLMDTEDR